MVQCDTMKPGPGGPEGGHMEIRRLTGEERKEAGRISLIAFHGRAEDIEKKKEEWARDTVEDWGAFADDGALAARVVNNRFTVWLCGRAVECGGIGGVSTLPEYRESGAVRQIFARLLPAARENGEIISGLYPFSHGFYRKFGYDTVGFRTEYAFSPRALKGHAHKGWVKQWKEGEPVDGFLSVYDVFARDWELAMVRTPEMMRERHFGGSFYKDRKFRYLLGDGNGATGYVLFEDVKDLKGAQLKVEEAAWTGPAGFEAVLGFLARFTADYGEIVLPLPTGVDLRGMVEDPYALTIRPQGSYMIRIVNMEKALSLIRAAEGVTIRVYGDEQIPENNGVWRVEGGRAVPADGEADLETSARAMGRILSGAASLYEAQLRGDARVLSKRDTLEAVFVRKGIYVGDFF